MHHFSVLEKECSIFRQERVDLESRILQLKHDSKIKKLKSLCKSTMTEPLEHSVSPPSIGRLYSSIKHGDTSFQPNDKNEPEVVPKFKIFHHRRSHSDGEALLNQRKQLETHSPSRVSTPTSKQSTVVAKPTESLASTVVHKVSHPKDQYNFLRSAATQTDAHSASQQSMVSKGKQERRFIAESHRCAFQVKAKNLEQRLQIVVKKVQL